MFNQEEVALMEEKILELEHKLSSQHIEDNMSSHIARQAIFLHAAFTKMYEQLALQAQYLYSLNEMLHYGVQSLSQLNNPCSSSESNSSSCENQSQPVPAPSPEPSIPQ